MSKTKLLRITTVPGSLNTFCRGLLRELQQKEGYEIVAVSSPDEELTEIAEREGVKTVAVPMERRISPLKDLKSLWRMIKVFRREKPQMIHSMTPKAGLLSMIAGWVCRVPVRIHTFTGLVFPTSTGLTKKILIFTDSLTCACATHIIPEGEGVKNDLQNYRITRKPLKVLGHGNVRGIDLEYYNPELPEVKEQADRLHKPGVFTFVFIGRLVGDKGINELVEAFTRLHSEYSQTRLLLIGPQEQELDPLKEETLKHIASHSGIEAVGSQKDVRPWLLASDTFVFPSYREGFPNVVIEAGAMGKPSIVTDINGSREIIIHGKNGVIIPARDAEALYSSMKQLMLDKEQNARMASCARELIASRFEQAFVRGCLKEFYKEILLNKK